MDFKEQLNKQLKFIRTSCNEYDVGNVDEAIRIATSLRVLFHDTPKGPGISILKHLHKKDSVSLLSTSFETSAFMNMTNIVINLETLSGRFVPKLDDATIRNFVPFNQWWEEEIIYRIKDSSVTVNRKNLALSAAHKDGGAHVDKQLEPFYEYLSTGAKSVMHLTIKEQKIQINFLNAHLAALRQIGYEVLNSPDINNLLT